MALSKTQKKANPKKFLYIGFMFLYIGILTRNLTDTLLLGNLFFFTGIGLKILFLILKIKTSNYKLGREVFLFITGLTLFLSGIYIVNSTSTILKPSLMVSGILLKISFIVIVLKKIKTKNQTN